MTPVARLATDTTPVVLLIATSTPPEATVGMMAFQPSVFSLTSRPACLNHPFLAATSGSRVSWNGEIPSVIFVIEPELWLVALAAAATLIIAINAAATDTAIVLRFILSPFNGGS